MEINAYPADNVKFTDTIWSINVQAYEIDQILPFSKIPADSGIQHLIISFCLYEPQINDDKTEWTKNTINFIHQNNIFPNLKNIYILNNCNVNITVFIKTSYPGKSQGKIMIYD